MDGILIEIVMFMFGDSVGLYFNYNFSGFFFICMCIKVIV